MPYDDTPTYPQSQPAGDVFNKFQRKLRAIQEDARLTERRAGEALAHLHRGGSTTEAFLILHGAR